MAELGFPVRRPVRSASLHVLPGPPETAAAPGTPVRVYVLAADALARAGIRSLLVGHPAVHLVGDGDPGALDRLPAPRPDVVLAHGDSAARQARHLPLHPANAPRPPLVVVGGGRPGGPGTPTRADGRLPDTVTPDQLASALVLAAAGYRVQPDDRPQGDAMAAPPVGQPKLRLRNRIHAAIYAFETGLRTLA